MDAAELRSTVRAWTTLVGTRPRLGGAYADRELWPVEAEDGHSWFVKRLSPWRNLPVADEARVLRHLASSGVPVAEFALTDDGSVVSGPVERAFVLMPRLASSELSAAAIVRGEHRAGAAIAELHRALAAYPYRTNSYVEAIGASLRGRLRLPGDVAAHPGLDLESMAVALEALPRQLVHGDLTPDNVLRDSAGEVTGFIDLDHLPQAPRIWDIAKYLSRRVRRAVDRTAGIAAFLDGYESVIPLTSAERQSLPTAVLAYNVLEVDYGQRVLDGDLPRAMLPDHEETLAAAVAAVRWQLAEPGAIDAARVSRDQPTAPE